MASSAAERKRSFPFDAAARIAPATIVLSVLLGAGGLVLLYAGRHLTFFYDEWAFVLDRRGGSVGTYLDPHNGHLVLFPVVVYKLLFAIFGLRHYTPYRLVTVVLHLIACAELYVLARRRIGPWLALAPTTLLLCLGSAWQVLLWPFQISYLGSVVGGLGALLVLETGSTRRRDVATAALLTLAVGSSGLGLAFVVGCGALILMRRDPWRRLWVVIVPAVLFGIWYLGWATGEHTTSDAILAAPQYVANAAAGASAGLAGLDQSWGPPLALLILAILVLASVRRPGGIPTPMVVAIAAAALTFWTLAAVTRADSPDPTASRYLYARRCLHPDRAQRCRDPRRPAHGRHHGAHPARAGSRRIEHRSASPRRARVEIQRCSGPSGLGCRGGRGPGRRSRLHPGSRERTRCHGRAIPRRGPRPWVARAQDRRAAASADRRDGGDRHGACCRRANRRRSIGRPELHGPDRCDAGRRRDDATRSASTGGHRERFGDDLASPLCRGLPDGTLGNAPPAIERCDRVPLRSCTSGPVARSGLRGQRGPTLRRLSSRVVRDGAAHPPPYAARRVSTAYGPIRARTVKSSS